MITKTLIANGSKGHHKFTLTVNEESTINNKSILSFTFKMSPIQNGWDWSGWGSSISYEVKIGDNTFTGTIPSYNGSSTITLLNRNGIEIEHEENGTKTIVISFDVEDVSGVNYTCGNANKSENMELTKLHKAPEVEIEEILELNPILIGIGVENDVFVPYISEKSFKIKATAYDNAEITKYSVQNSVNIYNSEQTPIVVDFKKENLLWGYDAENNSIARFGFSATDNTNTRTFIGWYSYNVLPYDKPNLIKTSSNIKRNGQVSGKVTLNLTGTFYNGKIGNKNNLINLSYKYWKKGENEPETYYSIPSSEYIIAENNIVIENWEVTKNGTIVEDINKNSIYVFKIKAIDEFNNTSEIELICPKGEWLMARFKDRVDFKKITIENNNIVSSGETENGTFTKYYDGRMICTGKVSTEILSWSQDSIIWHSRNHSFPDFASEFIEPPHVVKSIESINPTQRSIWINGHTGATTTNPGTYSLATYWNATDTSCIITYIAIGKWK